MPNVGDTVFFNEGNSEIDAWTVGYVLMTDTYPSSEQYDALVTAYNGGYPDQPASGQVYLITWGMAGNSNAGATAVMATEGTSPGQYSLTLPE